jgi:hypothetical protein
MQTYLVDDLPYLNTHARGTYQVWSGCPTYDLPYSHAIEGIPFRPELMRPAAGTVLVSSDTAETARLLSFEPGDIVAHSLATGDWLPYFDAAAAGLDSADVDAFQTYLGERIILSFAEPTTVPGIGVVDDSDLVLFNPANGAFLWAFDGSDVGLSTDDEDIDAIAIVDGELLVSTVGDFSVPGVNGSDEDFIRFGNATFGPVTSGTWSLFFDGSDVGLGASDARDLDSAWFESPNAFYVSPQGAFTLLGRSFEPADVLLCTLQSFGGSTSCALAQSGLFWRGSEMGLDGNVDALTLEPTSASAAPMLLGLEP